MIVQDIALLRATNKNILSTNKGYFLYNPGKGPQKPKRSFCVQHTTEQMQDELYTIVDYGGKVLDAVVVPRKTGRRSDRHGDGIGIPFRIPLSCRAI